MANSKPSTLPQKPHPDFPLFPHQSDRWAKKINGRFEYFGKVSTDPKGVAALQVWIDEKDNILAGRPRGSSGGPTGLTIADLCNRFLTAKVHQRDSGELTARSWACYKETTDRLIAFFGPIRKVSDLAAVDFERLRAKMAAGVSPATVAHRIQLTRVVFKYAFDSYLIEAPVRYGPMFKRPSKKVMRLDRAGKCEKLFTAAQLWTLIGAADVQLKAMILLAVNTGFGNTDCGTLPMSALDLSGGWVNHHRVKTGVPRRCPLWPETVKALRAVMEKRPTPKHENATDLVFVTRCGASWAKVTSDNPITKEFKKLLDDTGLHKPGLGFYAIRHVFRTIADESRDQPACDSIMGHSDESMAARYRERVDDDRLKAVSDHVRKWFRAGKPKAAKTNRAG
jgi:integrase